ncbi:hypothetical protein O6H91_03G058300 [Diphasiastrum complanatum]|uniref:Uncharacterized protein n=1 Tax=Diphasiastrum complanatum TaxID=34168 RepID=A0ACC2E733_DIPCM|nr:hypothetical protein O6H91_03G058300 [Diphasiastrum complanatum]
MTSLRFDHSGTGEFSLVTRLSGSEASSKDGGKSVTAFAVSPNMSDSAVSGVFSNVESHGFFHATSSTNHKLSHGHGSVQFPCSSISPPMAASSGRSSFSCTNESHRSEVSSESPGNTSDGEATLTEHDYIGLAEAASASSERTFSSGVPDLNLRETELRLGPPKAFHSCPDRSNETPSVGGHVEPFSGAWDEERQSYAACREQISCRGEGFVSCAADRLQTPVGTSSRPCEKAEMPRDAPRIHAAPQVTGAKRGFSEAICGQFAEESAFAANISTSIAPISRSAADLETKHIRSRMMPPVYPWGSMNQMHTSRPMDLDQSRVPFQPFSSARSLQAQQKSIPSGEAGALIDLKDSSAKLWDSCSKRTSDSPFGKASASEVLYGRKECPELPGDDSENAPASSAPVVGWPPVQSFRNKALATQPQPKPMNESQVLPSSVTPTGNTMVDSFFVKVYMDGVAIGRKVDLKNSNSYEKLSFVLEEMFHRFILGNGRAQKSNVALMKENKERSLFHGSDMFMGTVKRLRIMKGSDAIGLAPKASGKENTKGQR